MDFFTTTKFYTKLSLNVYENLIGKLTIFNDKLYRIISQTKSPAGKHGNHKVFLKLKQVHEPHEILDRAYRGMENITVYVPVYELNLSVVKQPLNLKYIQEHIGNNNVNFTYTFKPVIDDKTCSLTMLLDHNFDNDVLIGLINQRVIDYNWRDGPYYGKSKLDIDYTIVTMDNGHKVGVKLHIKE